MFEVGHNTQDTIALLDELAANAWPAPVQQQLGGWKLRAAGGLTRRANSVYTSGPIPRYTDWLTEARSFYARQGLPVRFQLSDGSPAELVLLLDDLGYSRKAHSEVQTAQADMVTTRCARTDGPPIVATSHLDEHWLEAFIRVEGHHPTLQDMYCTIMSVIGPSARFASVRIDGEIAGIGMAVCERGWTGLFNLATASHMRGRGVATAIIADLAQWSIEQGAGQLYLQVMRSNEVAKRLYAKLGFGYLYGYHYRTEPGRY